MKIFFTNRLDDHTICQMILDGHINLTLNEYGTCKINVHFHHKILKTEVVSES